MSKHNKNKDHERKIQNNIDIVNNSLSDAVSSTDNFPFLRGTEEISNMNSLRKNLRYFLVSNDRSLLSTLYAEIGLCSTIVDVPVEDAIRGEIKVTSQQLEEKQITDLLNYIAEKNDFLKAGQAEKWNRLFGGAGLITITGQNFNEELNFDLFQEGDPLDFRAVDMWELFFNTQDTDLYDPTLISENIEFYNYYGLELHSSKVKKLVGIAPPSYLRPQLRGWGLSVVEKLIRSINQYVKAANLNYEILDEFKLDIYKLKNLTSTLFQPGGTNRVKQRVQIANQTKNYQNAIVLDAEDDYQQKQLSFSGLAESGQNIRMQVASDMRMPQTKLFGLSAAGFNSGEDDLEVYNSMVESEIRPKIKPLIMHILKLRSKEMYGFIPDDLDVKFSSLRMMTSEQEENVKTQKFNRVIQAKQAGEITTFEFREACNKENLLPIKLDTSADTINPEDPNIQSLLVKKQDQNEENKNQIDQKTLDEEKETQKGF